MMCNMDLPGVPIVALILFAAALAVVRLLCAVWLFKLRGCVLCRGF